MYPCSANYDPSLSLPRSLTRSPSSGSHQDSDDLMMRETTLIIHTQQTSPLAVLLSHTDTLALEHIQTCTDTETHTPIAHSDTHKYRQYTEILALHTFTVWKCRHTDRIKNHSDAYAQTNANKNRSNTNMLPHT